MKWHINTKVLMGYWNSAKFNYKGIYFHKHYHINMIDVSNEILIQLGNWTTHRLFNKLSENVSVYFQYTNLHRDTQRVDKYYIICSKELEQMMVIFNRKVKKFSTLYFLTIVGYFLFSLADVCLFVGRK